MAVTDPPQVLLRFAGPAINKPTGMVPGRLSVKPISTTGMSLVLVIVIVRTVVSLTSIGLGLNTLLTLTPGRLVKDASVGWVLLTPLNVVTAPAGMRFVRLPFTFMLTRSVSVQVELG